MKLNQHPRLHAANSSSVSFLNDPKPIDLIFFFHKAIKKDLDYFSVIFLLHKVSTLKASTFQCSMLFGLRLFKIDWFDVRFWFLSCRSNVIKKLLSETTHIY